MPIHLNYEDAVAVLTAVHGESHEAANCGDPTLAKFGRVMEAISSVVLTLITNIPADKYNTLVDKNSAATVTDEAAKEG
jgi:hypothetical protein